VKTPHLQNDGATGGAMDIHVSHSDTSATSPTDPRAVRPIDPELALLIDRWPTLPDATKAAILAMAQETGREVRS
jgi:hypothetical protein